MNDYLHVMKRFENVTLKIDHENFAEHGGVLCLLILGIPALKRPCEDSNTITEANKSTF